MKQFLRLFCCNQRVALVVILGVFVFSHNMYAYNTEIHLNWGEDANYRWLEERAAMEFTFTIWNGNFNDDWVEYVEVSYGDDVVFRVEGFRESESYTRHALEFKKLASSGKLYANSYGSYDGATSEWTEISAEGKIVYWASNGSTGDDNKGVATIYWYPDEDCLNKKRALRLTAKTVDSGVFDNSDDFDDTELAVKMSPLEYGIGIISFDGYNSSTGVYSVSLKDFVNGDKYSHTKAKLELKTSLDNSNWYTQSVYEVTNKSEFAYTFSNLEYVKYPNGKSNGEVGYKKFAEGVYFRLDQTFDPDKGSGDYVQTATISQRTEKIAVLSNRDLSIEHTKDNQLVFSWNVYLPSSSGDVYNNWVIEKKEGLVWSAIGEGFSCKNGNNTFEYQLDINTDGVEKKDVYRVRNTRFAEGVWAEYMCTNESSITYYPYYQEFNSIHTTINTDKSATISWTLSSLGIWSNYVSLSLQYYIGNELQNTISLSNSARSYVLKNLEDCSAYTVLVVASDVDINYADTIVTSFVTPDAMAHEIKNFDATRGYYNNKVKVRWEVPKGNSFTSFKLMRRATGSNEDVFVDELGFNPDITIYSYEDFDVDPGVVYSYTVIGYTKCQENMDGLDALGASKKSYGFAQSYASVSGRVCFDANQGEGGVDIAVVGADDYNENYSLCFDGSRSAYLSLPDDVIDFGETNMLTLQAYVHPVDSGNRSLYLFSLKDIFEISLDPLSDAHGFFGLRSNFLEPGTYIDTLEAGSWQHITWAIEIDSIDKVVKSNYYRDGSLKKTQLLNVLGLDSLVNNQDSVFFIGAYSDTTKNFKGYIDEIRVWNTVLDSSTISRTYNRYISGRESNLRAYYRCNEPSINVVFDISGRENQFGNKDGYLGVGVTHSAVVIPSTQQLANKTTTDADGNYIINTISYPSDGVQCNVIPLLGVHEFSPSQKPIYISSSSRVFNNVDFVDKSSFEVKGKVYYENSDYPVAGCQVKVDGVTCVMNEKPVLTSADGEFTIQVPIGEHYIEVVREGHDFEYNGRYPADTLGVGLKFDFQKPISNLTFTDITKATIVGRVSGGSIETKKRYGGRLSENNIGVAEIVLEAPELYSLNSGKVVKETATYFEVNSDSIACDNACNEINSRAYIGGGDKSNLITIYTDTFTGEFAVQVPPIQYKVRSISIPSNKDVNIDESVLGDIDARSVSSVSIDTIVNLIDSMPDIKTLSYVADLNVVYRSKPVFNVKQLNCDEGVFGESLYEYIDEIQKDTASINLYTVDSITGEVVYAFDYPIFEQGQEYTLELEGYEEYVNYDIVSNPVIRKVPLEDALVTITNEFSVEQAIDTATYQLWPELASNQLYLDTVGKGKYTFVVGFPNLSAPHTYGVNIDYSVDGVKYQWQEKPLEAIILGNIQSGNQFVTGGPDVVTMILRDPPGSQSYSYFDEGTKAVSTFHVNPSLSGGINLSFTRHKGVYYQVKNGTFAGMGGGTYVQTMTREYEASIDKEHSIGINLSGNYQYTNVETEVKHKKVSTSSGLGYIGASGDVFIGCATNLLFGEAREVVIQKGKDGGYNVGVRDAISIGERFTTTFQYTQSYIEGSLIPNLKKVRNSLLNTVADTALITENTTDKAIYVTELTSDDPNFGQDGTYKVIYPKGANMGDTISAINGNIDCWVNNLRLNEEEKVHAIRNSYGNYEGEYEKFNYSFDSGASISDSKQVSNDTTNGGGAGIDIPYRFTRKFVGQLNNQKCGTVISISLNAKVAFSGSDTKSYTTTTGFVLTDADFLNAYTVDVIVPNRTDRSPIFYTRAGQTSCPYADEARTKYFEPGKHKLAEKTMQIEVPQMRVENATAINVPVGEAARYKLFLSNNSEIDANRYFNLCVLDETNPHGAYLSIDGVSILEEHSIRIRAGENGTIEKTLQLIQTDQGILEYDSIAVVLKSQCQGNLVASRIIADTIYIHASFIPSCSNISLQIEDNVLNSSVKGSILPIVIRDYNINYTSLEGVRLQYKAERDNAWTLLGEWLLSPEGMPEANLLNSSEITYNFDMSDNAFYPDGVYQFRAVTICTGDIYNESEVVSVIKDVTPPALLGSPLPSNGILGVSNEISVAFNEDIKYSQLTDTRNFIVEGRLNGYTVDHSVAIQLIAPAIALTEADFSTNKNSFTINLWLNYSKPGNILSFGSAKNKFVIGINDSQQFMMSLSDANVYTSTSALPKDKWLFLSVVYDTIDGGHIYANYVSDVSNVELLNVANVGQYSGRGVMTLGGGISAAMHELSIWNYPRSWNDTQSSMYDSKIVGSVGLVGYWRMDEGEGSICEDIARGRHFVLPSENAWYFKNENIAVSLDGKVAMGIDISMASPKPTDDYMLELWFRGEKQDDATTLLSNGLGFNVGFDADGKLQVQTADSKFVTFNSQLSTLNSQWHHLAINYLYNGMATFYVDGKVMGQIPIASMPPLASDRLIIGAERYHASDSISQWTYGKFFAGDIDEFRLWRASLTADFIRHQCRTRLYGNENGLVAYYPFERTVLDDFSQPVVNLDFVDFVTDSLSVDFVSATSLPNSFTLPKAEVSPSLREVRLLQNVDFSFIASERNIVINLEENADVVEGTTIQFTVRDVEDLNGNVANPISWTAYVHRNHLKWLKKSHEAEVLVASSHDFAVRIINYSGKIEQWQLFNLPSWLSVDADYGELSPLAAQELSFSVSQSLPIGDYEAIIYLVGNNNVYEPFVVNVSVVGQRPDWLINPFDCKYSMSIIGQLRVDNLVSEDEDDIVGAFIGEQCVGVASPVYLARYDAYYVMLDLFANDFGAVTFRVYDASTGNVYAKVDVSQPITFESDHIIGTIDNPLIFNTLNYLVQKIKLNRNWSWTSFYVDMQGKQAKDIISDYTSSISTIKSKNASLVVEDGTMIGQNFDIKVGEAYAIKTTKEVDFDVVGTKVNPNDYSIAIDSGWTWIGYTPSFNTSVVDAFADLIPLSGDIVKSQTHFAIYDGYDWIGSLQLMESNKGYKYKSLLGGRTFTYPSVALNNKNQLHANITQYETYFRPVNHSAFPSNMTILAMVYDGNDLVSDVEVAAFVDNECRATILADAKGYVCLTVPGEGQGDVIHFKVRVGREFYDVVQTLIYQDDAVIGSVREPYRIQIGESTALESTALATVGVYTRGGQLIVEGNDGDYTVYDAVGRIVYIGSSPVLSLPRGVYIVHLNDQTQKVVI